MCIKAIRITFAILICLLIQTCNRYDYPSNEINRQNALDKIDAHRPSHCSKLYGCITSDPQEEMIGRMEEKRRQQGQYKSTSTIKLDLDKASNECRELGFNQGTEKFGECVLKLSE